MICQACDAFRMHAVAAAGGLWHGRTAAKDQAAAEGGGESAQEATLPFEPITLVCRDLRYFVDAPKGAPPLLERACTLVRLSMTLLRTTFTSAFGA